MLFTKRAAIFCPSENETNQIKWFLKDYFKEHFPRYTSQIDFQSFDSIYQPKGRSIMGSLDDRDILSIIDMHSSDEDRGRYGADFGKFVVASYLETIKLHYEKGVSYLFYKGEFGDIWGGIRVSTEKRKELAGLFKRKLEEKFSAKEYGERKDELKKWGFNTKDIEEILRWENSAPVISRVAERLRQAA